MSSSRSPQRTPSPQPRFASASPQSQATSGTPPSTAAPPRQPLKVPDWLLRLRVPLLFGVATVAVPYTVQGIAVVVLNIGRVPLPEGVTESGDGYPTFACWLSGVVTNMLQWAPAAVMPIWSGEGYPPVPLWMLKRDAWVPKTLQCVLDALRSAFGISSFEALQTAVMHKEESNDGPASIAMPVLLPTFSLLALLTGKWVARCRASCAGYGCRDSERDGEEDPVLIGSGSGEDVASIPDIEDDLANMETAPDAGGRHNPVEFQLLREEQGLLDTQRSQLSTTGGSKSPSQFRVSTASSEPTHGRRDGDGSDRTGRSTGYGSPFEVASDEATAGSAAFDARGGRQQQGSPMKDSANTSQGSVETEEEYLRRQDMLRYYKKQKERSPLPTVTLKGSTAPLSSNPAFPPAASSGSQGAASGSLGAGQSTMGSTSAGVNTTSNSSAAAGVQTSSLQSNTGTTTTTISNTFAGSSTPRQQLTYDQHDPATMTPSSPLAYHTGQVVLALVSPCNSFDLSALTTAAAKYVAKEVLITSGSGTGLNGSTVSSVGSFDGQPQVPNGVRVTELPSVATALIDRNSTARLSARSEESNGDGGFLVNSRDAMPRNAPTVAVHKAAVEDGIELHNFVHPKDAIYVFTKTVPPSAPSSPKTELAAVYAQEERDLSWCDHHVYLSADQSYNSLAALVNIALYDRAVKIRKSNQASASYSTPKPRYS